LSANANAAVVGESRVGEAQRGGRGAGRGQGRRGRRE